MSVSREREILSPQHRALLQGSPHGAVCGWDFYESLVSDIGLLQELHLESLLSRRHELCTKVGKGSGDVSNSLVGPDQLHEYPITHRFAEEVAQHIGGRVLSAQFNYFGPGAGLLAHSDGPNKEPETTVTLSITGEADFEILPDLYAGYTEAETLVLKPGDGMVLSPIPARSHHQYTSRRHALVNTSNIQRVSLAVAYSPKIP